MQKLRVEDTHFSSNYSLRIKDKLFDLSKPKVMGIINCTPDSFYESSRKNSEKAILDQVEKFVNEGVDFIDIGGYSSRPGATHIPLHEEISRTSSAVQWIKKNFDSIPLSLDTFRSEVAKEGLENGVDIINDISAWSIDPKLLDVVSYYRCPYILMHMQGTPETMQQNAVYDDFFKTLFSFFSDKIFQLHEKGVTDIILDPGFGFGKTMNHNYEMLHQLESFKIFKKPILAGLSRKSMIYNKLNIIPEEALNGTTVLNTIALLKGASILRVHDVKEAREIVQLILN